MTETVYYNLARMTSLTTGDSDIILAPLAGCRTFADAGVSDSEDVGYGLITYNTTTRQPTGSETGIGRYISSTLTFKRTSVEASTDSDNSTIDLTGRTEIYLCPPASKFNDGFNPFAEYLSPVDEVTITDGNSGTVPIDSATFDDYNLGTFVDSDDLVTIKKAGWYEIRAIVGHYSNGSDYNGKVFAGFINGGLVNTGEIRVYPLAMAINSDEFEISIPIFHATADNTSFVQIGISNFTGQSLQGYLNRLVIKRLKKD